MSTVNGIEKDVLFMTLAIYFLLTGWFPLILVSVFITLSVLANVAIRRLDDYSGR
ncbi:hypothetical protein halTADL_0148 [Halohasta litchfieldiae]|jgi:uncharacterized membrane protein|uniref:Uncharacterized protein n=1 Tax=Halohasta litchfieldiae TaxID=1073996 RepID=A0A1H6T5H4_9EURY|nr:hypothetical protein halTADL_0148 [Halohasta litchfieldiae]SEI71520.1 hypothetical protein SAMN05444271_10679 [Halohasta litchfieldiae]